MAGRFAGTTAQFSPITLTNTDSYGNMSDSLVTKVTCTDNTGQLTWVQQTGGAGNDRVQALGVNGTSLDVAGMYNSTSPTFGNLTFASTSPSSNMFVVKLTDTGPSGSFNWAQQDGQGIDYVNTLAVSGTRLYLAGEFYESMATFSAPNVNPSTNDLFVAKRTDMGTAGSFTWAQRAGRTGREGAVAVAVSGSSVHAAGIFESPTAAFATN